MCINGFHYITLFKQNKNVLKLALPIIIELILTVGIGYINQFMFASFPEGTNAIGQVNQISNIFIVSFSVLATSSLILISQLRGANNESGIRKIYPLTLFINCLLGILVAIVLMAIAPFIFDWMQVDANIIPYAKLYLYVTAPSLIFYSLNQAFSNFLRANKRMIEPTIISVFMSVINIIIVAIVLWGVPNLDLNGKIIGVGLATLISRILSLIVSYIFFKVKVKTKISLKELKPFPSLLLKRQLKIGLPTAGETLSYNLSQFVLMIIINYACSVLDQNLRTYIMTFTSIIYLFAQGVGLAMQVVEGTLLGENDKEAANKIVYDVGRMARFISFFLSLIVLAIAYPVFTAIMAPAIDNPTINTEGVTLVYCGIASLICLSINVLLEQGRATNLVYVKGLETAGDIAFPVIMSISTSWLCTVGVSALLSIACNLGIYGAFIGACLDECVRALAFYIRWKKGGWKNKNLIKDIN